MRTEFNYERKSFRKWLYTLSISELIVASKDVEEFLDFRADEFELKSMNQSEFTELMKKEVFREGNNEN